MFRTNDTQQITMHDSFLSLPAHIQRLIEKSWAKDFSDIVFPAIDEERFSVLYSDIGSRPNTPVNVLIGSMLLKEYFGLTEEELLMSIYCDVLYQYALHLTQEEQPPVSDRSWSRFRERLLKYEKETGIDLMKAEMESLAQILADHMQLKGNIKRMDSLMVASRCKRMSRLEIIYTVNANAVRLLNRLGLGDVPALIAARVVSLIVNYILLRFAVFQQGRNRDSFPRYILLVICATTIVYFLLKALKPLIPVNPTLIKMGIEFAMNFFNYAVARFLVFGEKKEHANEA